MVQQASYRAGADLPTSRFMKMQGTDDHTIIPATGATDQIIGVTHEGTQDAPIPGYASTDAGGTPLTFEPAAREGFAVQIYGPGEECEIETGTGMALASPGTLVTSDADGKAVPASTGNRVGARTTNQVGADGERVMVVLLDPFVAP